VFTYAVRKHCLRENPALGLDFVPGGLHYTVRTPAAETHNKVYYYEVGGYDLRMYILGVVLLMSKLLSYGFVNVCFGNV